MRQSYIQMLVIGLSIILGGDSRAQTPLGNDSVRIPHKNIISTNPLYLGFGMYNVSYERALNKRFGINLLIQYEFRNREPYLYSQTRIFTTHAHARFYPFGKAPGGFFAGGYLLYGNGAYTTTPAVYFDDGGGAGTVIYPPRYGHINCISFGAEIGYRFLLMRRISLEIAYGGGPNFYSGAIYGYDLSPLTLNFMVVPAINIGYAFK